VRVERIETFLVPPRWLFAKVTCEDGTFGWGEPVVEGKAATVAAAVKELSEHVIGRDAENIEDIWQTLYRGGFYRGGPILMSAIAGIDQALWDIKGKRHGLPVHQLLGGLVRERVQVYSWIGGDRPQDVCDQAKRQVEAGFRALKMNACDELHYVDSHAKIEAVAQRVALVREAVGSNVGIAVDFHGRVHRAMAKVLLRELEPYHLMFVEEPVLPEHMDALASISSSSSIPIALGERLYSRWDFKHILASGLVDIIQPDLSHAGGISEVRKIAAMAEAYDVAVAPHCPLGPIALAACLQLDGVTPNVFIQEQSLGIHYNTTNDLLDYLRDASIFAYHEGFVRIPDGPGLGVEVHEPLIRELSERGHAWHNPLWRHEDGTVAEW
jgi:galactonate dehydratase